MKKDNNLLFKVLTPFVCAAIMISVYPNATTKEQIINNEIAIETQVQKNYLSEPPLPIEMSIRRNPNLEEKINDTKETTIEEEPTTTVETTTQEESITETESTIQEETTEIKTTVPLETTIEVTTTIEETIPPTTPAPTQTEPAPQPVINTNLKGEYPIADYVYGRLLSAGFTPVATCAILGNMMVESGRLTLMLDERALNLSSGCYGLCQWKGLTGTENYIQQVEYLLATLPNRWCMTPAIYNAIKNATDIYQATKLFFTYYEMANPNANWVANEFRVNYAWTAYTYYVLS